jgi:hypothetical protein
MQEQDARLLLGHVLVDGDNVDPSLRIAFRTVWSSFSVMAKSPSSSTLTGPKV